MSHSQLSPDQRAVVEARTRAGIGPSAIAQELGLLPSNIEGTRRKLIRAGLAPSRPRPPFRRWDSKETDQLINLVEQGFPYAQIARKLKRTETSIRLRCKRIGVLVTTTNATMSARDVATQLGVACSKTVSGWIRRGWLRARDAGHKRPLWRITWDDLTAFLENPDHWLAWEPDRIPDLALREWTQELRANEPRYLSHSEIAGRLGVGRDTVGQWIDKGWLPAVRYGNRYVPEAAIDGFVVPIDRNAPMNQDWPKDGWHPIGRAPGARFMRRPA
jgi:excisionase family DNA binding protein